MADFPASIGLTVDSTEAIKGINKVSNAFDNLIKDATDFDKALASAVNTLNRLNSVASKIRSPFELAQAQKANALLNKQVEAARERLRIRQAEVRVIEQAQRAQKLLTGKAAPNQRLLPASTSGTPIRETQRQKALAEEQRNAAGAADESAALAKSLARRARAEEKLARAAEGEVSSIVRTRTGDSPRALPSALQREQTKAAAAAKSAEDKAKLDVLLGKAIRRRAEAEEQAARIAENARTSQKLLPPSFELAKLKSFSAGATILGEDLAAKLNEIKTQVKALPPSGPGSRSVDRKTGFSPRFQSRLQAEVDRQIKETGRVNKELQELVANYNEQQTSSERLVKTQDRLSTELDKTAKSTKATERNTTRKRNRFNEGLTGAGFSALFGGGLFETIGGGAGGFAGGLGVSLALSNLGRQLDNLSKNLNNVGTNLDKPAEALKALEESGFKVDDSIKKQVDSLLEVGKAYEAQQLVLQQITDTLGPQAVNQLNAYAEETEKLEEQYKKAYTALVKELLPAMVGFVTIINNLAGAFDNMPKWVKNLISGATSSGPFSIARFPIETLQNVGRDRATPSVFGAVEGSIPAPTVDPKFAKQQEKLEQAAEDRKRNIQIQNDNLQAQLNLLNSGLDLTTQRGFELAKEVITVEYLGKLEDIRNQKIDDGEKAILRRRAALEQSLAIGKLEQQQATALAAAAQTAQQAAEEAAREQERVFKGLNSAAIRAIDLSIRYAEATGGREAAIERSLYLMDGQVSLLDQQAAYAIANIKATEKNLQLRQFLIDNLKTELDIKKMALEQEKALLALERERTLEAIRRQKADSAFQNESQLQSIQTQLDNPFGGDALAQQLQAIEQQNRRYAELENIKRRINDLDEQAAIYEDNDPRKKALQDQVTLQKEYLNQKVKELDLLDAAEQKLLKQQQLFDKYGFIVNEVSSAFSNAITSLVTGTGTVEEAFSRMFENIGKAFIDMATKMLAQKLFLTVLEAFGGGSGFTPTGGWGNFGSINFAEGGYVTGPTRAIVGEGGSSEYVVPENKMPAAMARWNAGMRGDAVVEGANSSTSGGTMLAEPPAPEIKIEGGVMQFNDTNYIRQDQLPGIISQAGKLGEARTLQRLQMHPNTRRKIGI